MNVLNTQMSMVVAHDRNMVIGLNGKIPWHIPEDFKFFKKLTETNIVIMGRKTWESLPHKPLENRINIVISNSIKEGFKSHHNKRGFTYFTNIDGLYELINGYREYADQEIFVIGGELIYTYFLSHNLVNKVYATIIKYKADCTGQQVSKCPEYQLHLFTHSKKLKIETLKDNHLLTRKLFTVVEE